MVHEHPRLHRGSRQRVFGYNAESVAVLTGQSVKEVGKAAKDPDKLDLGSLRSVCSYVMTDKLRRAMEK